MQTKKRGGGHCSTPINQKSLRATILICSPSKKKKTPMPAATFLSSASLSLFKTRLALALPRKQINGNLVWVPHHQLPCHTHSMPDEFTIATHQVVPHFFAHFSVFGGREILCNHITGLCFCQVLSSSTQPLSCVAWSLCGFS